MAELEEHPGFGSQQGQESNGASGPPLKRQRVDNSVEKEPSLVVHVRNLNKNVMETDLLHALCRFGEVAYVKLVPNMSMALVEFEELNAARSCIMHTKKSPIQVAGNPALFDFSVKKKIDRVGLESEIPNNILILSVHNAYFPVTLHAIHQVCKPNGNVRKIVFLKRPIITILVEFESIECATRSKHALNGAFMYHGSNILKAEYAKADVEVNVPRNAHTTWDFTIAPTLPDPNSMPQPVPAPGRQFEPAEELNPPKAQMPLLGMGAGPMTPAAAMAGMAQAYAAGYYNQQMYAAGKSADGGAGYGSAGYYNPQMYGGGKSAADGSMGMPPVRYPPPAATGGASGGEYKMPPPGYGASGGGYTGSYGGSGPTAAQAAAVQAWAAAYGYGYPMPPTGMAGGHEAAKMGGGYDEAEMQKRWQQQFDYKGTQPQQHLSTITNSINDEPVVMMIYGLHPDKFNCDKLFNLVCLYGNVLKVKFMASKTDAAMIEMGSEQQMAQAINHLHQADIYGNKLKLMRSKQATLHEIQSPYDLPDGTPSFKDYTDFVSARNHRFQTAESFTRNKMLRPTAVLHFFNAPPNQTEENFTEMFVEGGATAPKKVIIFPSKTNRSSAGIVEFENVEEAFDALLKCNHYPVHTPKTKAPYIVRLAFSAKTEKNNQPTNYVTEQKWVKATE